MLSQHQLRVNTNAAAYIVLVGHVTCDWPIAYWIHPPRKQLGTDMYKNVTFPQLRLHDGKKQAWTFQKIHGERRAQASRLKK